MKTIDVRTFLSESTIERDTFEQWVERRWIVATTTSTSTRAELSEADAARAIFIRDLTSELGVNDEGIEVVLHLVDQLHGLRRVLAELRGEANASPRDAGD